MGLYNFQERFCAGIESGEITHTIRGPRLYGRQRSPGCQDRPGDVMHLYTGMRTKACRLLGRFVCAAVEGIRIAAPPERIDEFWGSPAIWINGELLTMDESEQFARRDGFESFTVFQRYWRMNSDLPFDGFVLHWKFERKPCKGVRSHGQPQIHQESGTASSTKQSRARSNRKDLS